MLYGICTREVERQGKLTNYLYLPLIHPGDPHNKKELTSLRQYPMCLLLAEFGSFSVSSSLSCGSDQHLQFVPEDTTGCQSTKGF